MKCKLLGVAALAVMAATSAVRAQETTTVTTTNPMTFGVLAGVEFPIGDFGDVAGTGWHIGGLVGFQPEAFPLGLRIDAQYHGLGNKELAGPGATLTQKPKLISGTANAVWEFPAGASGTTGESTTMSTLRPYVIGGLGVYHVRSSFECDGPQSICGGFPDSDNVTKFGINVGGGVEFQLAGFAAFAEARWNGIFGGSERTTESGTEESMASFIPISFGIRFR